MYEPRHHLDKLAFILVQIHLGFLDPEQGSFVGGIQIDVDGNNARASLAKALPFPTPDPTDPAPNCSATEAFGVPMSTMLESGGVLIAHGADESPDRSAETSGSQKPSRGARIGLTPICGN